MAYELWKKEMHPFYRKAYKQTGYSQYEYRYIYIYTKIKQTIYLYYIYIIYRAKYN